MPLEVQLVLLAGGRSSRMGTDKLTLRRPDGSLMVQQWLDVLQWDGPTAIVLPPSGAVPGGLRVDAVLHDTIEGDGPLRGVLSAIDACAAEWLLVVPIDMPGIGRPQLDWLLDARATRPEARALMSRRTVEGGSVLEPLPLLLHRDLRPKIAVRLANGRRSLHGLTDETDVMVLDAPAEWPETVWANLNRPDDLAAYLAR